MACDLPTPWDLKGSILSIPSDPAQCLRPSSHQLRSRVGGLSKGPRGLKGMRMWKVWSFAISSFVHLAFLGGWTPILKMATGTIQESKIGEPRRLVKYCQRITIRPLFRTTVDSIWFNRMQATPVPIKIQKSKGNAETQNWNSLFTWLTNQSNLMVQTSLQPQTYQFFLFGFWSFSCTCKTTTNIKSPNNPKIYVWRRVTVSDLFFDMCFCVWKKHVFDSSCGHLVFHQPRDPQQKQDACSKALQEPAKVVKIVKTQTPKAQRLETLCTSFELQVQKIRIYSQDSTLWPQTSQRQMCWGMQLPGPWLCFGTGHPHEFFNTRWWALHRCRPIGARRRWANWICRRRPKAPSPPPWMQLFSGESDGIRWLYLMIMAYHGCRFKPW